MNTGGIFEIIERQDWLTPAEETLQNIIHKLFQFKGGRQTKNLLHGTWIGDPLHVILSDVPLGSWTATVVFDALDSRSNRRQYSFAADAALTLGLVAAVGTAAAGLTDFQDVDPPVRRVGLIHGLLNLASVGLFATSLVRRRRGRRSSGRSLAALGYAVSVAAARLGGHLVYREKIGVDHSTPEKLPEDFTAVLPESELHQGIAKKVQHEGTPILLVRDGQRIYAVGETCSHLGGPLSEGELDGDVIQCPWHGSRFSLRDGSVVDGPAVHPVPCLEARIRHGQVEVRKTNCRVPADSPSGIERTAA